MKESAYTIQDEIGIHARPAGLLVKEASNFKSAVVLECKGKRADARRLMAVMSMGVKQGDQVRVTAQGEDEELAIEAMEACFREHL